MKIEKLSLPFLGFLQGTGLLIYIGFVSLFFLYGEDWFGKLDNFLGPIFALLLFVISAVVCGLIFLGRAGYLFWEKRYKESVTLIVWTLGWSLIYLLGIISTFVLCR